MPLLSRSQWARLYSGHGGQGHDVAGGNRGRSAHAAGARARGLRGISRAVGSPLGRARETLESLGQALRTGGALLASVDGQPAGCVFYSRERDHVYLGRLSVLAAHRSRGLGGALTDGVERLALAMGVPRVKLGVRTALPALRAYYERRGYLVIRLEAHAGYSTPTSVVMQKELR